MIQQLSALEGGPFSCWPAPACFPQLKENEAHIWRAPLDVTEEGLEALRQPLSSDELERASHFRFLSGRNQFMAARGTLRKILGGYLNTGPSEIRFRYGPFGKPELDNPCEGGPLRFSVSHSGQMALYAVALGHDIGVDIEFICGLDARTFEDVARQFFSRSEGLFLAACPAHVRKKAFFRLWTRKEAYLKALGAGLSEAGPLLKKNGNGKQWSTADLHVARGYAASVAFEGGNIGLSFWQWVGGTPGK